MHYVLAVYDDHHQGYLTHNPDKDGLWYMYTTKLSEATLFTEKQARNNEKLIKLIAKKGNMNNTKIEAQCISEQDLFTSKLKGE